MSISAAWEISRSLVEKLQEYGYLEKVGVVKPSDVEDLKEALTTALVEAVEDNGGELRVRQ